MRSFIAVWFFVGILFAGIFSGTIEQMDNGQIDWGQGVIRATGSGAPPSGVNKAQARLMTIRAAKMDAYRNIAEIIKGVRINSTTVVNNYVTESDEIRTQVKGFIKGARQVGKTKYLSDGSVEVTLECPMTGNNGLSNIVYSGNMGSVGGKQIPSSIGAVSTGNQFILDEISKWKSEGIITSNQYNVLSKRYSSSTSSVSQNQTSSVSNVDMSKQYSGLVIDARNLGLRPAMSPKVISESGKEIYGSAYVKKSFAVQWGMAGYAKSVDQASVNDRVKSSPLVIKGVKLSGNKGTDVIISNADAARLVKLGNAQSFISKCKVIFVID